MADLQSALSCAVLHSDYERAPASISSLTYSVMSHAASLRVWAACCAPESSRTQGVDVDSATGQASRGQASPLSGPGSLQTAFSSDDVHPD